MLSHNSSSDDEEIGNAGNDTQNLQPEDLDDEQLRDLGDAAETELNEKEKGS